MLKKRGANKGAISAFLISTPESGIDSIAISLALLDPILTVLRPVAAFLTAICAGFIENAVTWNVGEKPLQSEPGSLIGKYCDDGQPERPSRHLSPMSILCAGFRYGLLDIWGDIVLWFFAGLLVAGFIMALVPQNFIERWLGGGVSSMVLMLLFGIPLYICASASTPVAAALILKGVSPGAALVFLLAGPATNITSLSVFFNILGRKSTFRFLLTLSVLTIAFGLGTDEIYRIVGVAPKALLGQASELVPLALRKIGAVLLLVLSIRPVLLRIQRFKRRSKAETHFKSGFPQLQ